MARKIEVQIVGDASQLERSFAKAAKAADGFGSSVGGKASAGLKTLGKAALVTGAAVGAGFAVVMKKGFDELAESEKVTAQTEAVLKSTGAAANVTAKQVSGLAEAISRKSGIDDEAIQSGQNLLLTFTNVRNEVGAGNDIFNQATQTITDMSVALGQDMKSSALQLGKALNDPVKGMTALQRVGVSFTDGQKKTVAQLVKTGDTLGAQKLILAELNKEFGGSAKAYGDTMPGQLAKLRNAFDEAAGKLAQALLPALTRAADFLTDAIPKVSAFADSLIEKIGPAVEVVVSYFEQRWPAIQSIVTTVLHELGGALDTAVGAFRGLVGAAQDTVSWLQQHKGVVDVLVPVVGGLAAGIIAGAAAMKVIAGATKAWAAAQVILNLAMVTNPFVLVAGAVIALGAGLVIAYQRSETFRDGVNRAFAAVKSFVLPIVETLRAVWERFGDDLLKIARTVFGQLRNVIETPLKVIKGVIDTGLALIHGDWSKAWDSLKGTVGAAINGVVTMLRGALTIWKTAAIALGNAALDGVKAGLEGLGNFVRDKLDAARQAVVNAATYVYGNALAIGKRIVSGVVDGLGSLARAVADKISGAISSAFGWIDIPGGSPPEHAARVLIGEKLVRGILLGTAKLPESLAAKLSEGIKTALETARSALEGKQEQFGAAFGKLGDFAARAFDAKTASLLEKVDRQFEAKIAKWQRFADALTPAEQALADIDKAEAKRSRDAASSAAQAQLAKAQAMEAGVEREQAIADALEAIRQADLANTRVALEARAATERDARNRRATEEIAALEATRTRVTQNLEEQRRQLKDTLDAQLANLVNALSKHPEKWDTMSKNVVKLIKSYGGDTSDSGKLLGNAFANGIDKAQAAVTRSARSLAQAAADAMANVTLHVNATVKPAGARAAGGPVTAGRSYLVGEKGPELFTPGRSGEIIPSASTARLNRLPDRHSQVINITVNGGNGSPKEVAQMIRRELYRIDRRNGRAFGTT